MGDYFKSDLPRIIKEFHHLWQCHIVPTASKLPSEAIAVIKDEIVMLMRCSGELPVVGC